MDTLHIIAYISFGFTAFFFILWTSIIIAYEKLKLEPGFLVGEELARLSVLVRVIRDALLRTWIILSIASVVFRFCW